jgi:hypothetical protein
MRRWIKVAVWAAVFLTCAGAGAYLAAHSNPFPPGVDRAGVSSTTTPSASPPPTIPERWTGTLRAVSYHQLYVGGRCTTRWRGTFHLTVNDTKLTGQGHAHLLGTLVCDFPIAQVQTRLVLVDLVGRRLGGRLTLVIRSSRVSPKGSSDFGGFLAMLPARLTFHIRGRFASDRTSRSRPDDEGRGTFFWSAVFQVQRVSG